MAPFLAFEMEDRGDDSWGGSNGVDVIKETGPITMGFRGVPKDWVKAIFHTRGASVGPVSKANAHPFVHKNKAGQLVIGVHNGGVTNWKHLNEKYKRTFEVDSEHIIAHIAEDRDFNDLYGYGTVAWFEDGIFSFAKSTNGALEVVQLDTPEKEIVICSTLTPIIKLCQLFSVGVTGGKPFAITASRRYFIDPATEVLMVGADNLKWGYEHQPKKVEMIHGAGHNTNYSSTVWDDWGEKGNYKPNPAMRNNTKTFSNCKICYKMTEDYDHIVCRDCMMTTAADIGDALRKANPMMVN